MQKGILNKALAHKTLCILCSLVLALSLVPISGFAQDTVEAKSAEAATQVNAEETVEVASAIDEADVVEPEAEPTQTLEVTNDAATQPQEKPEATPQAQSQVKPESSAKTNSDAGHKAPATKSEKADSQSISSKQFAAAFADAPTTTPPMSEAKLAAGVYTVSANVYVLGEDNTVMPGVQPYLTNPLAPPKGTPTTPMTNNAQVIVGEDGSITLDVEVVNKVFTLQAIGNGEGVTVKQALTVEGKFGGKTSRISHLTLKLAHSKGAYTLNGAEEYITLFKKTMNAPIQVAVDFAHANKIADLNAKPVAPEKLTYTGLDQVALPESDAYTIKGTAHAINAGTYEYTATLKEGQLWADGTNEPVTVSWSIAKAPLKATYKGESVVKGTAPALAVIVDGFVNGEDAATAAGYKAPTVALPNGTAADKLAVGEYKLTPAGGEADNYEFAYAAGTLIVKDKNASTLKPGTYKVSANLYIPGSENPILPGLQPYFTNPDNPLGVGGHMGIPTTPMIMNATMVIDKHGKATVSIPVQNPVFTLTKATDGIDVHVLHTNKTTIVDKAQQPTKMKRISKIVLRVDNAKGTYTLGKSSAQYVTLIEKSMNATTKLDIDFDSAKKISNVSDPDSLLPSKPEQGGDTDKPEVKPSKPNHDNQVKPEAEKPAKPNSESHKQEPNKESGKTFKAGTYTVSANIWLSKEDTGLPLNPHFTNGSFPPMDPVAKNATLYVDANGHAQVKVPIVIQKKIMDVKSITGLNIVNSSMSGNGLSSITVDLGILDSGTSVVTLGCTANVHIGDLAMTIGGPIFGGVRDHTYPATFQMNISGIPSSGGGAIPENVQHIMKGEDPEKNKLEDTKKAADKALADIEKPVKPGSSESADATDAVDNETSESADEAGFPWAVAGVAVVAIAAVGAFLYLRKKK